MAKKKTTIKKKVSKKNLAVKKLKVKKQSGANTISSEDIAYHGIDSQPGKNRRGVQVYTTSQLLGRTGKNKDGKFVSSGVEQLFYTLSVRQREELFERSSPVFGVVTRRMNRISASDFNVVPTKNIEDRVADKLKEINERYVEHSAIMDVQSAVVQAQLFQEAKMELFDLFPDFSNFNRSLLRWKKRIKDAQADKGEQTKEWLMEPNNGTSWEDFVKKFVKDLLVQGAVAVYKDMNPMTGILQNFDLLPGGTVHRFREAYFSGIDLFIQIVAGFENKVYGRDEIAWAMYYPSSTRSTPIVPLEALVSKLAEYLLFDNMMAEQADGDRPPEKLIIVTNPQNSFGTGEGEDPLPMNANEQARLETKVNETRKNRIMTFSGNDVKLIDLTRENTMGIQTQRQKDIREDVAVVFNASNIEMNLSGSDNVSGRNTADVQMDIGHGTGILPIIQQIENFFTRQILPYRIGTGYTLEFDTGKDEIKERELDRMKLETGELTQNELREEKGRPTFKGEEFDLPKGGSITGQPGENNSNPLFISQQ